MFNKWTALKKTDFCREAAQLVFMRCILAINCKIFKIGEMGVWINTATLCKLNGYHILSESIIPFYTHAHFCNSYSKIWLKLAQNIKQVLWQEN